jgi:hypothetical protein
MCGEACCRLFKKVQVAAVIDIAENTGPVYLRFVVGDLRARVAS